jgi:streptogramin lyase
MEAEPSEIAFAFGSLWVVSHRAATITRIDPASGEVTASVTSPRGHLVGVAASRRHVWFLSSDAGTVEAVDATSNEQDISVPVDSEGGGIAPAPDGVWFAGTNGKAVHIHAGRIDRSVRIAPEGSYLTPWLVGRRLFVADSDNSRLTLLDATTSRVLRRLRIGGDLGVFASTSGSVWLGARSGPLRRLDPATAAVQDTVVTDPVDHLALCGGLMWVRVAATTVVGLDPASGKVETRYDELPASEIPGGGMACAHGALWVVNWSDRSVWQIPVT